MYECLQKQNLLNEKLTGSFIHYKTAFSQSDLMDICELYGISIQEAIKTNYAITHPLLKQILKVPNQHKSVDLSVNRFSV